MVHERVSEAREVFPCEGAPVVLTAAPPPSMRNGAPFQPPTIVKQEGSTITVSRPWDIPPGAESEFIVVEGTGPKPIGKEPVAQPEVNSLVERVRSKVRAIWG